MVTSLLTRSEHGVAGGSAGPVEASLMGMTDTFSGGERGGHVVGAAFPPVPHSSVLMPPECSPAPMDRCAVTGDARGMNRYRTPLAADAAALRSAANVSEKASCRVSSSAKGR